MERSVFCPSQPGPLKVRWETWKLGKSAENQNFKANQRSYGRSTFSKNLMRWGDSKIVMINVMINVREGSFQTSRCSNQSFSAIKCPELLWNWPGINTHTFICTIDPVIVSSMLTYAAIDGRWAIERSRIGELQGSLFSQKLGLYRSLILVSKALAVSVWWVRRFHIWSGCH